MCKCQSRNETGNNMHSYHDGEDNISYDSKLEYI